MQAVSGITPDLRASCMAPNPPFPVLVLAISQELSVWEQTADYSFGQKEGNRHCPEGETCGAVQESCYKDGRGVEAVQHGCRLTTM